MSMLRVVVLRSGRCDRGFSTLTSIGLQEWEVNLVKTVANLQLEHVAGRDDFLNHTSWKDPFKLQFSSFDASEKSSLRKKCPYHCGLTAVALKHIGLEENSAICSRHSSFLGRLKFWEVVRIKSLADAFQVPIDKMLKICINKSRSGQLSPCEINRLRDATVDALRRFDMNDEASQLSNLPFTGKSKATFQTAPDLLLGSLTNKTVLLTGDSISPRGHSISPTPMEYALNFALFKKLQIDSTISLMSPFNVLLTITMAEELLGSSKYANYHLEDYRPLAFRYYLLKSLGFDDQDIVWYLRSPNSAIQINMRNVEKYRDFERVKFLKNIYPMRKQKSFLSSFDEKLSIVNADPEAQSLEENVKKELAEYLLMRDRGFDSDIEVAENLFVERVAGIPIEVWEENVFREELYKEEKDKYAFEDDHTFEDDCVTDCNAWYRRPLMGTQPRYLNSVRGLSTSKRHFSTSSRRTFGFHYNKANKTLYVDRLATNIGRSARVSIDLAALRSNIDRSFDKLEFLEGCKLALPAVTNIIKEKAYNEFSGLLTKRAREELVSRLETEWTDTLREGVAIDQAGIIFTRITRVNCYNVGYDMYADITVAFTCANEAVEPNITFVLEMTFSRNYSKTSLKDWVITDVEVLPWKATKITF